MPFRNPSHGPAFRRRRSPVSGRRRRRAVLESLEERRLLATFTVVTGNDSGTGVCTAGQCTLRDAIVAANANVGADEIRFAPTITGTIDLDPVAGALEISESASIIGPGDQTLTVHADTATIESRVIDIVAGNIDVDIEGLTLTGGRVLAEAGGAIRFLSAGTLTIRSSTISGNVAANAGGVYSGADGHIEVIDSAVSGNTAAYGGGGALQNVDGNITVTASIIDSNQAYNSGGGIFSQFDGDITITNSEVTNNRVTYPGYQGGGVSSDGGNVTISGSTLTGNTSAGDGGGIYNNDGSVTITDSTINGNVAGYGGGAILNETGTVSVSDSNLQNNRALYGDGGGIASLDGSVTLTRSTISGNQTVNDGGGISVDSSPVVVLNSTLSGNFSAGSGGGIASTNGPVSLTNTTVSGNTADMDGGGVHSVSTAVRIDSSTITRNHAVGGGGGIGMAATNDGESLVLINTIVAQNVAAVAADFAAPGIPASNLSVDFSLIGDPSGTTLTESSQSGGVPVANARGNLIGDGSGSSLDPLLGPLSDNGGPTPTHAPMEGSFAIDAGNASMLPTDAYDVDRNNDTGEPLPIDQRGAVRVVTSALDIGAVELGAIPTVTWDAIADIVFATPLGSTQLDATANTEGSFDYSPPSGTVLDAGDDQMLSATFHPLDSLAFRSVTIVNQIDVAKADPTVSWSDPEPVLSGTQLGVTQLNATADVDGTFLYNPGFGQVLSAGDGQQLAVTFTPNDALNYNVVMPTVSIDVTAAYDYGDAAARYPVTLADDGARHVTGPLRLGLGLDNDMDGQPSATADGDGADDDGVSVIAGVVAGPGNRSSLLVTASHSARLDAWIDFNGDGDWQDAGEQVADNLAVNSGANILPYEVPDDVIPGETVARFRLSSQGDLEPTGEASDGEVEDHLVSILDGAAAPQVTVLLPLSVGTIRLDQDTNGVSAGTVDLFEAPISELGSLTVRGSDEDNTIVIEIADDGAMPGGGLLLDGVQGANTLTLAGTSALIDLTDVAKLSASRFGTVDLTAAGENVVAIDAGAVTRLSPADQTIRVIGGESDRILFADADDWRLTEPLIVAQRFLQVATHTETGQVVQVDLPGLWQNPIESSDINNDGRVTAADALQVINELGRRTFSDAATRELNDPLATTPWPGTYYDQNGDGRASAVDALGVINLLSRVDPGTSEGESVAAFDPLTGQGNPPATAEPGLFQKADQVVATRDGSGGRVDAIDRLHQTSEGRGEVSDGTNIQRPARPLSLELPLGPQPSAGFGADWDGEASLRHGVDRLFADETFVACQPRL